jgi:hypothetical protein
MSACVLLLAAGTERHVIVDERSSSRVGIHRLYTISTSETDYDSLQKKYRQIESKVRSYLKEMNVPEALYDAMMRIPSENAHFLSSSELEAYNLNVNDPVYADWTNSRAAAKYGLDKPEYLRRKARTDQECKIDVQALGSVAAIQRFDVCEDDILRGRR